MCDSIKNLELRDDSDHLSGHSVVTIFSGRKEGGSKQREREEMMVAELDTVNAVGPHTMHVGGKLKKQGCLFSFRYSRKNTMLLTSCFQPRSDFQPPEM